MREAKKVDISYKFTHKCWVVNFSNHIHKKVCKVNRTDFKGKDTIYDIKKYIKTRLFFE